MDSLSKKMGLIAIREDLPRIRTGEDIPGMDKFKLVNDRETEVKLSDYRGKLLILDFWHQWCSGCLGSFPEIERLQEKFKDKVKFLLVSWESRNNIVQFLQIRRKYGKDIRLPSIVEDTLLRKYFPHPADPFDVWIDEDGRVIAMTDQFSISEANIESALKGDYQALQSEDRTSFDYTKPLKTDIRNEPDLLYQSVITKYASSRTVAGIHGTPERNEKYLHYYNYNQPVLDLFRWAMEHSVTQSFSHDPYDKRVVNETSDSLLLTKWSVDYNINNEQMIKFRQNNFYSYELVLPLSFADQEVYQIAQEDLQRFFKVQLTIEKRKVKCLALVHTDKVRNLKPSKERRTEFRDVGKDVQVGVLEGMSLGEVLNTFNNSIRNFPLVINETNKDENDFMNTKLSTWDDLNVDSLTQLLKEYNLKLVPVERNLDMLVIKDRKQ